MENICDSLHSHESMLGSHIGWVIVSETSSPKKQSSTNDKWRFNRWTPLFGITLKHMPHVDNIESTCLQEFPSRLSHQLLWMVTDIDMCLLSAFSLPWFTLYSPMCFLGSPPKFLFQDQLQKETKTMTNFIIRNYFWNHQHTLFTLVFWQLDSTLINLKANRKIKTRTHITLKTPCASRLEVIRSVFGEQRIKGD